MASPTKWTGVEQLWEIAADREAWLELQSVSAAKNWTRLTNSATTTTTCIQTSIAQNFTTRSLSTPLSGA